MDITVADTLFINCFRVLQTNKTEIHWMASYMFIDEVFIGAFPKIWTVNLMFISTSGGKSAKTGAIFVTDIFNTFKYPYLLC